MPLIELEEEIGVEQKYVQKISLRQIYRTFNGEVDLTFFVKLSLSSNHLKKSFQKRKDNELIGIKFYTPDQMKIILSNFHDHRVKKVSLL